MTQIEFGKRMADINTMQYKEKNQLFDQMEKLDTEKRTILDLIKQKKIEMESLYSQLSAIKDHRGQYMRKLREINIHYHEMKHQLCVDHPKEETQNISFED